VDHKQNEKRSVEGASDVEDVFETPREKRDTPRIGMKNSAGGDQSEIDIDEIIFSQSEVDEN
jgi:hypothetical protein